MNPELLNKYIDGELRPEQAALVEQAAERNPALRRHLAELRAVSRVTRAAMEAPVMAGTGGDSTCARLLGAPLRLALAASIVLTVGVSIGWALHSRPSSDTVTVLPNANVTIRPEQAQVAVDDARAIVHVSAADPNRFQMTLDDLESLLERYERAKKRIELEIIANGPALDLLRQDTSPASARIRELQEKYRNLTFLACRKTLERVRNSQGKDVVLVPGVKIAPSALEQILMRLQHGWTYIQA